MKEIIAQFSGEISQDLRRRNANPAMVEVQTLLSNAGASIDPLHPDSTDPTMSRYFVTGSCLLLNLIFVRRLTGS